VAGGEELLDPLLLAPQATTAFRSLFRAGALMHDAEGWLFDAGAQRS